MNNIKKATIFYFSGTGNAKCISLWLAEFAANKEIPCKVFDITRCDRTTISASIENALVLIISPTHGFNFPAITLKFIRKFPKGNNPVIVMNTRGGLKIGKWVMPGLSGIALMLSAFILWTKGYKITGMVPFDMPANWLTVHPALKENAVKYLHQFNYRRVEKHAEKFYTGQPDFSAFKDLIQDILISPIALGYFLIGRFAIAKSFYASSKCDACGLCLMQCPVHAIKMVNTRPFWTFKCESCMHCMNHCPKNAIEVAHGLFVIVSIVSSFGFTLLLNHMIKLQIHSSFLRLTIWSGIFLLFIWALYALQHFLLKYSPFSKLIAFTSFTSYKFWGRYKSIPDDHWKK